MFVVLEGEGALRVDGEMLPIRVGDVVFVPAGRDYPHSIVSEARKPA